MKTVINFPKPKKKKQPSKIKAYISSANFFFLIISLFVCLTVVAGLYMKTRLEEFRQYNAQQLKLQQTFSIEDKLRYPGMVEAITIKAMPKNIEDVVALLRLEVTNAKILSFTAADGFIMAAACENGSDHTDSLLCVDLAKSTPLVNGEPLGTLQVEWQSEGSATFKSAEGNGYYDTQDVYAVDIEPLVVGVISGLPMTGDVICPEGYTWKPSSIVGVRNPTPCCNTQNICVPTLTPTATTNIFTETVCFGQGRTWCGEECCPTDKKYCQIYNKDDATISYKCSEQSLTTPLFPTATVCTPNKLPCTGNECCEGFTCSDLDGIHLCTPKITEVTSTPTPSISWDCSRSQWNGHQYKSCVDGVLYWCDGNIPQKDDCNNNGCIKKQDGIDDVCNTSATSTPAPTSVVQPTRNYSVTSTPAPTELPATGKMQCGAKKCEKDADCMTGFPDYECDEDSNDWPNNNVCVKLCKKDEIRVDNCTCSATGPTPVGSVVCGPIDIDGNNELNHIDLATFVGLYNKTCSDTAPTTGCKGKDTNNDGKIDYKDLASFVGRYHSKVSSCVPN